MEEYPPHIITVSKRGVIRYLGAHVSSQDLPHLIYIQWASLNELQTSWSGLSIWMMNETVFIWAPGGHEIAAHWTDEDKIQEFCREHGERNNDI